jgi:hypothetical protein
MVQVRCRRGSTVTIYVKGTVEVILNNCTAVLSRSGEPVDLGDLEKARVGEVRVYYLNYLKQYVIVSFWCYCAAHSTPKWCTCLPPHRAYTTMVFIPKYNVIVRSAHLILLCYSYVLVQRNFMQEP